jgi:hypothetical protein
MANGHSALFSSPPPIRGGEGGGWAGDGQIMLPAKKHRGALPCYPAATPGSRAPVRWEGLWLLGGRDGEGFEGCGKAD